MLHFSRSVNSPSTMVYFRWGFFSFFPLQVELIRLCAPCKLHCTNGLIFYFCWRCILFASPVLFLLAAFALSSAARKTQMTFFCHIRWRKFLSLVPPLKFSFKLLQNTSCEISSLLPIFTSKYLRKIDNSCAKAYNKLFHALISSGSEKLSMKQT